MTQSSATISCWKWDVVSTCWILSLLLGGISKSTFSVSHTSQSFACSMSYQCNWISMSLIWYHAVRASGVFFLREEVVQLLCGGALSPWSMTLQWKMSPKMQNFTWQHLLSSSALCHILDFLINSLEVETAHNCSPIVLSISSQKFLCFLPFME